MPFGIMRIRYKALLLLFRYRGFMRSLRALALLALTSQLFALDPNKALTQDNHRIWGQEEGLFQPTVYAIRQTRDGFLWLGTQDSLIRFDGLHFREYDQALEAGLKRSLIRSLLDDRFGNLWVGSIGSGLVRIAPNGTFKVFGAKDGVKSSNIFCLAAGTADELFACTEDGLLVYREGRFHLLTTHNRLPTNNVRNLCQTPDGTLWAAGLDFGLVSDRGKGFIAVSAPGVDGRSEINALACSADNSVWIGKPDGLVHLAFGKTKILTTRDGLPDNAVSSLFESTDGSLWIGTNDGVTRYREGRLHAFRARDGLSHRLVLSLFTDREGTLWVGTKNGLDQFTDGKLTPYTTNEGMQSNSVGPVVEDAAGLLWIGSLGQGLSSFNGTVFQPVTTREGLLDNTILSLFADPNGDLWVGTRKGLNCLRKGRVVGRYTSANGLAGTVVTAVFRDADGTLWAGTDKGLSYLLGASFHAAPSALDAQHRPVVSLSGARTVRLFVSSVGPALSYLKDGVARDAEITPTQPVSCFYFDRIRHIGWLGTLGSGLLHWQNGKFVHIRIKDGLYDSHISAILRDEKENLWFASSKGIFRVSEQQLIDFVAGKIRYVDSQPFTTGQLHFECTTGVQPAAYRTRDGRFWFSTTNGLMMIDPNKLSTNNVPPPTQITSVFVNGERRLPLHDIVLSRFERNLEIRFAGLSFIAPEKVSFQYRLDGFDKGWTDAGPRRQVFYTDLPPGPLLFRVRARNADGIWSKQPAQLSFYVTPRLYQRIWFFPAMAVLLAGSILVWYRLRIQRLRQSFRLVLSERNRIARELHDTLLQGLSGVTMQMQALLARLGPSHERETLGEIIQDAARCSREARRSLWGLRSDHLNSSDFGEKLTRCCRNAASGSALQLHFELEPVSIVEMPDAEFQLLRIAQEIVNNAVRHSEGTLLEVQLRCRQGELELTMADNGKGFDKDKRRFGHFGLIGMNERAKEIGATLTVESAPSIGTRVVVHLPLGVSPPKASPDAVKVHQWR